MGQKKPTFLNQSTFFATLFALTILVSYLVINGPGLVVQWQYATGHRPDSRPIETETSLEIPKIGTRAPIILAEESQKDNLSPLLLNGVVHYPDTALPGESGNCVYIGHSSNYWWQKSDFNYVFALIGKLAPGDKIIISHFSHIFSYTVSEIRTSPKNLVELFTETDGADPTLTLVTCWPNGTDFKRLLVKARLDE